MDSPRSPIRDGIALDVGLALAICALELSDLFVFNAGDKRDPVIVLLLLGASLPVVVWRRWPLVALQLTGWATIALAALHATHLGLGPIAATYAVASWGGSWARRVGGATLLVAVWLVPILTGDESSIPRNAALFGAAWMLGALMRDRRLQTAALRARTVELAREREENAALAAENERARIARELHDVLTHSVSVMVIQAQAAQTEELDAARVMTALKRIETIGQEALTELRTLLRRVGHPADPPARSPVPGIDRLDELVDAVRAAGVQVSLTREGETRRVPASVELSAYRIVQEALTNAIRHTPGARAHVALRYAPEELAIEIRDEAPADHGRAGGRDGSLVALTVGEGRGITGMRERAFSVGGTLVAEACPEGGFRVAAHLPLGPEP